MFLLLPARLGQARDFAAESDFANLAARQSEFTERATRTTRDRAAVALASGVRITRQLLQSQASEITLFIRLARVVDHSFQFSALGSVLGCEACTLLFTFDQC